MKALITGGAGFIGSHLADRLINEGHFVCVIDDLSTGSFRNIRHLKDNKKFVFIKDTIFNQPLIERSVSKCDIVYHFAAAVGVKYILENLVDSIRRNAYGTQIILEAANKYKRKTFIASSSEIYGKNDRGRLKEDDDRIFGSTNLARWSYSCTKELDEFMALAYYKEHRLPVIVARFFNICGPRQVGDYGMVVPTFVKQVLQNKPITVYGDGLQTRSFTYIKDAIDAITKLTFCKKAVGEIFNVGNGQAITILELAKKIRKISDSKSKIVFIPYNKAYKNGFEDMRYRVPAVSKIKKFTGFSPKIKIDEMLKLIMDYYRGKGCF